jgi:molybdopterin biosynthesis enzyme
MVPDVLQELGVEQVFHKISLRPGKPLWFGVKHDGERRVLVFGLPGNPVSSFVCLELFVRPAISAMAGPGFAAPPAVSARLNHAFHHAGGRAAYLPAVLDIRGSDSKSLSQNRPPRGGQAHFAAKTPQNEPVPDDSGIGSKSGATPRLDQDALWKCSAEDLTVTILPWQGSADLATLACANGLARLTADKQQLLPGAALDVVLI